jgi:hypothetical protein
MSSVTAAGEAVSLPTPLLPADRVTVAVTELLPRAAVKVALWLLAIEAAAVALNVVVVAPAATVTDAGTVSKVLLLASLTEEPPGGAFCVSVTVQALAAPGARLEGLHASVNMSTGADTPIAAVIELPPRVAVKVALWSLVIKAAAVALNVAVVAPAATVTDAGTMSKVLLLVSLTDEPPVGAAWVSVTVHVLTAPCPRLPGLQVNVESCSCADRLMFAVFELLPRVAVTVALWLLVMEAAAVALKVAVVAPAATVTDAGTVSEVLPLASVTVEPPAGAVWVTVTVQVLIALCPRLVGLQASPDIVTDPERVTVVAVGLPPRVAVTVTLWLLAIEAAAVALKVAEVAPAVTVTDAGTVSEALLLASEIMEPPAPAAWLSVTVQVLTAPCPRLEGPQASVDIRPGADRPMVAVVELPPRVAVTTTLW